MRMRRYSKEVYGLSARQVRKTNRAARRNPRKFSSMTNAQMVGYAKAQDRHGCLFYILMFFIPIPGWIIIFHELRK